MGTSHSPAASSKKMPRGTPFQPGHSGNKTGRARKTEEELSLEMMCKDKTPGALSTILHIMDHGQQERSRLAAAQYIIDRGWGKARETVDVTMSVSIAEQIKQANADRG